MATASATTNRDKMQTFNINDTVHVKITAYGHAELERQHNELLLCVPSLGPYTPKAIDDGGYSKFQAWSLMATFGHMMDLGTVSLPFELDIKLKTRDCMKIENLRKKSVEAKKLLAIAKVKSDSGNFAYKLAARSLESHLGERE